jgi:hypothetical protein
MPQSRSIWKVQRLPWTRPSSGEKSSLVGASRKHRHGGFAVLRRSRVCLTVLESR